MANTNVAFGLRPIGVVGQGKDNPAINWLH
jgi:hypothetical protein